jgi:hypothetical protein
MGKIVDDSTARINAANTIADTQIAFSGDTLYKRDDPSLGFFATVGETYMHETWIGSAMRYGIVPSDEQPWNYEFQDSDFNPFRYYLDNRDDLGDMDSMMKNGLFDDVITERQYMDRVERLRKEIESKQALANGSTLGLLAGGVLSFADVSTLIPGVNVVSKLRTGGRVAKAVGRALNTRPGKYALAGGYYSAVQEAGLHGMQDLRTLEESAYNTAGGVVLGGVLGGAIVGASKSSPLHPSNPNYVLRPESKVMMGIKSVGDSLGESAVLRPVMKGGRRTYEVVSQTQAAKDLSAAAVKGTELLKTTTIKGQGVARGAVKAVGRVGQSVIENTVGQASPIIRGLTSKSQVMMNITEGLYDLGGILTKGHTKGHYKESVEDIANRIQSGFDTDILIAAREQFVALQEKLAQLGQSQKTRAGRGWQNLKEDVVSAVDDFKQGPQTAGRDKPQNLEGGTGNLRHWEFEDVIRHAMHEDLNPQLMQNLEARFGKEGAKAIVDSAKAMGEEIHKLNKIIEDMLVEKGLITEDQRLGRNYVMPQAWDGKGIRENKANARRFFLEVFSEKPTDDFLDGYWMNQEQFEKLGVEDVTVKYDVNGETKSITYAKGDEGFEAKLEMLEEWSGKNWNDGLDALETAVKNAEDEVVRTKQQAILASRGLRKSTTDYKNASVEEAENVLRLRQADLEAGRARRAKAQAERKRLQAEIMEMEEAARIAETTPVTPRQLRTRQVREGEQMLDSIKNDPTATPKDFEYAQENLTRADIDAEQAARQRNVELNKTDKLKRARARINQLNKEINRLDRRLPVLEKRLADLDDLVAKNKASRKALEEATRLKKKAAARSKRDKGKAERDLKRLIRKRDKAEAAKPLHLYVEDLVDTLAARDGSGSMPIGHGINKEFFESGRTKTRMIKLTSEQRAKAEELGILRNDLFGTLHEGVAELSKRIAFRDVFGHMGKNEDEILKAMQKQVEEDWDFLIAQAKKAGRTSRHIAKMEGRKRRDMKDIENGVKRQLGVLQLPQNPEGVLHYLGNKAREFNYVRYGSGFLIPSITDLSNVALQSGFGTVSYKNLRALRSTVGGMNNAEIRRLGTALELLMHNSRQMKMNNTDDLRRMAGIGDYGTRTHRWTSQADRALSGLGRATNHVSGMLWWNTRLKMLAMIELQHNFTKTAAKYGELLQAASAGGKGSKAAELEIAKLASLGIGQSEMSLIQKMFNKHPPEETDGILELGMGRWLDEGVEGQRAYEAVMNALEHVANRAIMTPGKGDTPFFMSSNWGKTLMQFQTYGFVIMTRYMEPAFQRMATYGDMEAFLSFGMALALGTGVVYAKDILNNGEIKERDMGQWAYDVVDRSGFLTYMSPYIGGAMMRLSDQTPSRYSREKNRGLSLVFGPTGGLAEDLYDLGDAVSYGEFERARDIGGKLLPFSMYQKIFKVIFGDDD